MAIISIIAWLLLRSSPVVILFRSSFSNVKTQILRNDNIVLDTLLTSDASTGFCTSDVIYASLCDKIMIKVDTFSFYIQPSIFKSRYSVYRLKSGRFYVKKIDEDELLKME